MASDGVVYLPPMAAEVYGEGLPYAPENWPEEGDVWGWRTGRRVVPNGTHFQDRYLYLPKRLHQLLKEEKETPEPASGSGSSSKARKQHIFASKLGVKAYVIRHYPDTDLKVFFDSFSWKIPAITTFGSPVPIAALPLRQISEEARQANCMLVFKCNANNEGCPSVVLEKIECLHAMPCDICCTEPLFCRACSCMLCGKTVSTEYGSYSYVKCQVNSGTGICGHVSHVECALQCFMAGKVEGAMMLDAEYHCRRCDGRTDMIPHVSKIMQTCKTMDSHDQILKLLNLGSAVLRGSEKPAAKDLLDRVELTISKVKSGTNLEDIWKEDDNGNDVMDVTVDKVKKELELYNGLPFSVNLDVDSNQLMKNFRKSQELEYKVVEEIIYAHKIYLNNLHEQLEYEKSLLKGRKSSASSKLSVRERKKQMKRELNKYVLMKKVGYGFSRTPHAITKKYFGFKPVK